MRPDALSATSMSELPVRSTRPPRTALSIALAVLAALAGTRGAADEIESWDLLRSQAGQRDGLFSAWSVDQRDVLNALRAIRRAADDRGFGALERRVRHNPLDLGARDLLGEALMRKGRLDEAIQQFLHVLAIDPAFSSSRVNLAGLYRRAGRPDLAERELAELVRRRPADLSARKQLISFYAEQGKHQAAATILRGIVDAQPAARWAQIELARALLLGGQADDARHAIRAARSQLPEDVTLQLLAADAEVAVGRWDLAQAALGETLKAHPQSEAALRLALCRLHEKDLQGAKELFLKAIAASGGKAAALTGAAVTALGLRDYDAAIDFCSRLRADNHPLAAATVLCKVWLARGDASAIRAVRASTPRLPEEAGETYDKLMELTAAAPKTRPELALQLSLVELFRQARWLEPATEAAEAARQLVPRSRALGDLLADCYAAANRAADELALRERLLEEHPDDGVALRGLVRACLRRGQRTKAMALCSAFLKRLFDNREARALAGELAFQAGDYAEAANHCRVVVARHPDDDRAHRLLLDALVATGDLSDAGIAVRARQASDLTFNPGPFDRATLAVCEGRLDDALRACEQGTTRNPFEARLWFLTGLIRERRGELRQAVAALANAEGLQPGHIGGHLALGRVATRAGDLATAVEAYRALAVRAPGQLDMQFYLAEALSRAGRHADAIAHIESLAPAGPAERRAVNARLAEQWAASSDPKRALELAAPVLLEEPSQAIARAAAVEAYRQLSDVAQAAEMCERILRRAPAADVDADLGLFRLLQGRYREADAHLARAAAVAKEPAERAKLLKRQAAACAAAGRVERGREVLGSLTGLPRETPAGEELILTIGTLGSAATARAEIAQIAKTHSAWAGWLLQLLPRLSGDGNLAAPVLAGHVALASGWFGRAVERFEAALKLDRDDPALLYALARSQLAAGLLAPALATADALVRVCPKAGMAYTLKAKILDAQGEANAAAVALCQALPLLDKPDLATRLSVADRLANTPRIDEAIEAFGSVIELDPANAAACNNLAWLIASHKPAQLAEAERFAAAAAKASPGVAAYHDTLGWIRYLRKDYVAARADFEAALALVPAKAVYVYHFGMVNFAQGRRERAQRALEAALRLDPKLPEASTAQATLKLIEQDRLEIPGPPRVP